MSQPGTRAEEPRPSLKRRDLRLLPLLGAVWAAALLCVFVPQCSWWAVGGCGAGAVLVVLAMFPGRAPRFHGGGGLAVLLLAAMAATGLAVALALPARAQAADWSGRVAEVSAEVTSSASIGRDGRLWFDAQTVTIGTRDRPAALSAPVRIGVEPGDGFDLGARVRVVGQVRTTDAGERSALVVFASETEVVEPASGVFAVAAALKRAFVERALRLPEPGAGLLPGLAVGDTRAVSAELNDDMRTSGLSHLTAVSGDIVC